MDSLREYCCRFKGITRVFKTIQSAFIFLPYYRNQIFQLALEFAQQDNILQIYRYIEKTALNKQVIQLKIDKDTAAAQFAPYQDSINNLQKNIFDQQNPQNIHLAGLSYIQLGNLYLKAGDVTEAFYSYEKVFKYYESEDQFSYYLQWSAVMLIEQRYIYLRSIAPNQPIPNDKKRSSQYTTLQLFQALCCLYQENINDFLSIIKDNISSDCVVEDENLLLVSSLREIGIFVTVCALKIFSREQVQNYLMHESVRFFVTQDIQCLRMLEAYIELDYKILQFYEIISDNLFKQYLFPFKKISMDKVADTLDLNQEIALEYVKRLIQVNQINFLYDPIDNVLVQKFSAKDSKYYTYKKAVQVITDFLRKKQFDMLKYQLDIVDRENNLKNKIELNEGLGQQDMAKIQQILSSVFR